MKKVVFIVLISLILFGIMLNSAYVFAERDSDNGKSEDKENSNSVQSNNQINTNEGSNMAVVTSNSGDNSKNEDEESNKNENSEDEESEEDINDNEVIKERRIENFVDENGQNVSVSIRTEIRTRDNLTIEKIKVKEIEIESEVELEDEIDHDTNETKFRARLSNGNKEDIKIMPDQVSERAIEVLQNKNLTIILREVGEGNNSRVVYVINGTRVVKLIGLFKIDANLVAVINPQTGQVEEIQKPWWFFLVFGNDAIINAGNSTITNQTAGNETISNSTITNSTIDNSTVINETIANNTIVNQTIANSSNSTI